MAKIQARRGRRQLMEDNLRPDLRDAIMDGLPVQGIQHDWSRSQGLNPCRVRGVTKAAEDLVLLLNKERNKSLADGSGCARQEDSHRTSPP
jgi:hypothetical protein